MSLDTNAKYNTNTYSTKIQYKKNIYFLNSVEVEGGFSVVKTFKHTSILTPFPHQI